MRLYTRTDTLVRLVHLLIVDKSFLLEASSIYILNHHLLEAYLIFPFSLSYRDQMIIWKQTRTNKVVYVRVKHAQPVYLTSGQHFSVKIFLLRIVITCTKP